MNSDNSTPEISDQAADELAAQVEAVRTPQIKSAWQRPSVSHIDITRTMFDPATV
jgi:hypothetical protein